MDRRPAAKLLAASLCLLLLASPAAADAGEAALASLPAPSADSEIPAIQEMADSKLVIPSDAEFLSDGDAVEAPWTAPRRGRSRSRGGGAGPSAAAAASRAAPAGLLPAAASDGAASGSKAVRASSKKAQAALEAHGGTLLRFGGGNAAADAAPAPLSLRANASLPAGGGGGFAAPLAVCGANSLVRTGYAEDCRLVSTWYTDRDTRKARLGGGTCSAFKIGDKMLGSAAHCVYDSTLGGFATTVDVYCRGSSTSCGVTRTTYGTYLQITPSYIQREQRQWDGAVIKTAATLPGSAYSLGQYGGPGTRNVEVTGFPAQNSRAGMSCNNAAYSGACLQYSSRGTLSSSLGSYGLYSSTNLDLCAGNSGGAVYDLNAGAVTAITIAETASPCTNYFTPMVLRANADANCERSSGGVSLVCLAAKVP
ncbi:hypothetical protein Rsub_11852 [Raphidocelis subcapitata]|uniref:Peptidase S1 domain-containing protein n=1 Tax=Raphidocelis subcapitata TaxID=307507 RepID=A0A2V0PGY2_9CHLO|nr:hypothetical protein Rsub_11852 [Raphidocelis subcapitata]|eukprot:GBF99081.1 hypothetical protein Rsub_11852 [Raphidocelis subcapitata]